MFSLINMIDDIIFAGNLNLLLDITVSTNLGSFAFGWDYLQYIFVFNNVSNTNKSNDNIK